MQRRRAPQPAARQHALWAGVTLCAAAGRPRLHGGQVRRPLCGSRPPDQLLIGRRVRALKLAPPAGRRRRGRRRRRRALLLLLLLRGLELLQGSTAHVVRKQMRV